MDGVPGREENVDEDGVSRVAMMKSCGATRNQPLVPGRSFILSAPASPIGARYRHIVMAVIR